MPTIVTTITDHDSKQGVSARGPWLLNIFKGQDGREYATLDKDIAGQAFLLLGQPVELEYEERQKNVNGVTYTNYGLLGVKPAEAGVPAAEVNQGPVSSGSVDDRQTLIMRQSALKLAIYAFGAANEDPLLQHDSLLELADTYLQYFVSGRQTEVVVGEGPVV